MRNASRRKARAGKCEETSPWALGRKMLGGNAPRRKVLGKEYYQEEVLVGQCYALLYVLHALLHAQCRFFRVLFYGHEDLMAMNKPRTNDCTG